MMRRLLIISVLTWLLAPTGVVLAAGCGVAPKPPTAPLGCKAMLPTCVCDVKGDCHWEFICARQ
jgi:hypothetical protein